MENTHSSIFITNSLIGPVSGGPFVATVSSNAGHNDSDTDEEASDPRDGIEHVTQSWFSMLKGIKRVLAIELCHKDERDELEDGVDEDQTCNSSPDPATPRVCAYADEQGYQGDGGETDAELSEILGGDPFGAGQSIFGFAAVLNPERERATLIV